MNLTTWKVTQFEDKKKPSAEGFSRDCFTSKNYYGPGVQVGWQGKSGWSYPHFGVQVGIGVSVKVLVGRGVLVSEGIGVQDGTGV